MCTITSSASINTQSAAGSPSIRTFLPNRSLILSASLTAIDATWRVERPGSDHHVVGDVRFAGQAGWTRPPAPGRRRATEERACEGLQRRWGAAGCARVQRDVRSRGLLANNGRPRRANTLGADLRSAIPVGILRANSGCGRRIGRQAKEKDRRCTPLRPMLGLARRMDEPSAASPSRAPRGQLNHSRGGESPQSALRELTPSNHAICENLAGCRFRATK